MSAPEMRESINNRESYLSGLIKKLKLRKTGLEKLSRSYSYYRLLIFLSELVLFFVLFFTASNLSALISLAIFFIVFGVVTHFHSKLDYGIKKLDLWIKIKTTHFARLYLDWQNIPPVTFSQKNEPNEVDLNIIGDDSLIQLINTGTSLQSEMLLRKWLNVKDPSISEIVERQNTVRELVPLMRFRDKLTLNSALFSMLEFDGEMLNKLLNERETLPKSFKVIFWFLTILAPVNVLLFVLSLMNILPAYWGISILIYYVLLRQANKGSEKLLDEAEYISDELRKLTGVFKFLEKYKFRTGTQLSKICEPFKTAGQQPSELVKKFRRISTTLRLRKANPFVWIFVSIIFPASPYIKQKLNKYKKLAAGNFTIWLETWFKLEAFSSLANFAYLNPEYTFPEITEAGKDKVIFRSEKLGHPLIKKENKICNDFTFSQDGEIAIITGSNMSGKSTFVRTLGINLSLAYAGSVVNADRLKTSLFRLFTCIRVTDSVTDGISYFYAEVKRLKALLDEIEKSEHPVLFLIDEIFRGTNNIERLKGSSAFIKKLAETNAVGAIATHDLELVKLADKILSVKNYHFKEEIRNGKMIFDYKLNNGPCPTTNALKIMKLEGLPVE
jgi:ABC-type multidrug transport system fused ATPase/permease subunit